MRFRCPLGQETKPGHINSFQHFHAELPYKGIYQNVKNTSFMHTSEIVKAPGQGPKCPRVNELLSGYNLSLVSFI